VKTLQLQSDFSGDTSADVALNWDVALAEIDFYVKQIKPELLSRLCGQTTDSGGGGVLCSVKNELSKLD